MNIRDVSVTFSVEPFGKEAQAAIRVKSLSRNIQRSTRQMSVPKTPTQFFDQ
jgi:hypothetical protein